MIAAAFLLSTSTLSSCPCDAIGSFCNCTLVSARGCATFSSQLTFSPPLTTSQPSSLQTRRPRSLARGRTCATVRRRRVGATTAQHRRAIRSAARAAPPAPLRRRRLPHRRLLRPLRRNRRRQLTASAKSHTRTAAATARTATPRWEALRATATSTTRLSPRISSQTAAAARTDLMRGAPSRWRCQSHSARTSQRQECRRRPRTFMSLGTSSAASRTPPRAVRARPGSATTRLLRARGARQSNSGVIISTIFR
jgi:hypothetical protein